MLSDRKDRILQKLAQMGPPQASMMSAGAPQLVAPPQNLGVTNPPAPVPYGGARPPMQSPLNMISPNTLKTPAVRALTGRYR